MMVVLTIAGSDPIAGAGAQADLKTFAALGVYGTTVITAVTSQNTSGVDAVFPMTSSQVRSQLDCITRDVVLSAVKIGMLATVDIVELISDRLAALKPAHLVVDPVMLASNPGVRTLLAPDAVSILKSRLLPLASVVTPNVSEAESLSGLAVESLATAREAARRIFDLGPRAVVVKGGHLQGEAAVDLLYDGRAFTEFSAPRVASRQVHGAGCAFSAAISARLALGDDTSGAVAAAKRYVNGAILHAIGIGGGASVLNHFWNYTGEV
jgi:hydroxymethylpyrimidine/phosphomethylpyrimidine kinase